MSKKLKLIPFELEHLKIMDVRADELKNIFAVKDIEGRLRALQQLGEGLTIVYDHRVLGVIGYYEMWPGVCEVWIIPSGLVSKYSIVFARIAKRQLEMLPQVRRYHRIQVTALDDKLHNDWLTWLGFTCEGTLKNYSMNKQDYKIWAKV